jgi:hypothetical protein
LNGANVGCCYFAYAKESIVVDTRTPLSRVPIFRGMRPKGGLFIENEHAGTLYLKFHSFGDGVDNLRRLDRSTWWPPRALPPLTPLGERQSKSFEGGESGSHKSME